MDWDKHLKTRDMILLSSLASTLVMILIVAECSSPVCYVEDTEQRYDTELVATAEEYGLFGRWIGKATYFDIIFDTEDEGYLTFSVNGWTSSRHAFKARHNEMELNAVSNRTDEMGEDLMERLDIRFYKKVSSKGSIE